MNKTLKTLAVTAAIATPAVATVGTAVAGSAGTEFAAIGTQLTNWLEGSLGLVISLASLAIGLGIGAAQQSVMAVVVGITMAVAVFYGPGVIGGVVSAGLPF